MRRLLLYLEESIHKGTQWAVFEPNEEPLWTRVRRSVTSFLITIWRNRALMGVDVLGLSPHLNPPPPWGEEVIFLTPLGWNSFSLIHQTNSKKHWVSFPNQQKRSNYKNGQIFSSGANREVSTNLNYFSFSKGYKTHLTTSTWARILLLYCISLVFWSKNRCRK